MSDRLRKWLAWEIHARHIRPWRKARRGPPRDWRYRQWVRSLPCLVCHSAPSQAAHTGPHGIGQKSSDYSCIPLCHWHHTDGNLALDRIGRARFERTHGIRIAKVIRELGELWRDRNLSTANR